jgi:hypothetical protein
MLGNTSSPLRKRVLSLITRSSWNTRLLSLSAERNPGNAETAMPLMLASLAIPPNGEIPAQYTCDGADISPPLSWSDVPAGTGRLALVVEDPDAPSGVFRHWAVFDIPPTSRGLDAGYSANRPIAALHPSPEKTGRSGQRDPTAGCGRPGGRIRRSELTVIGADKLGLLDDVRLRRFQHVERRGRGPQVECRPADCQQAEVVVMSAAPSGRTGAAVAGFAEIFECL